jgi:hypothetical protein
MPNPARVVMIVPASAASMRDPARSPTERENSSAAAASTRTTSRIEKRPEKSTAPMWSAWRAASTGPS